MNPSNRFTRNLLATAVVVALPGSALAQQLEEVMVTATKRVESTQDIPMAVEAFDGETLNQLGVLDFATLSETIPNFNVGDGVVTTNVSMRGMGSGVDREHQARGLGRGHRPGHGEGGEGPRGEQGGGEDHGAALGELSPGASGGDIPRPGRIRLGGLRGLMRLLDLPLTHGYSRNRP